MALCEPSALFVQERHQFSQQLSRMLGVTVKTAWFMSMRIREAMVPRPNPGKLGGEGAVVESDEAELGPSEAHAPTQAWGT